MDTKRARYIFDLLDNVWLLECAESNPGDGVGSTCMLFANVLQSIVVFREWQWLDVNF